MQKNIAILGSTGSIGTNTLRVIKGLGEGYCPVAISAYSNVELLAAQAKEFRPQYAAIVDASKEEHLRNALFGTEVKVLSGAESLIAIAELDEVDTVLTAVVGAAGLGAVMAAAEKGKTIAIANKEPLVIAGELFMETARRNGATILPIDSEHSAVFQAMQAGRPEEVHKIILTASGGPFRTSTLEQIKNASIDDALAHPTWNMGPKITIDSATMMNKALEIIEAHWLFNLPVEKIDVMIHPESIVHSMVEFVDGSIIAQLGRPDMCVPIQYALTYPKRVRGIAEHLKLEELGRLAFEKPNIEVFRALALGYEVARRGGSAPVVFNAANESAVAAFLGGQIRFSEIVVFIEECLEKHNVHECTCLEDLLEADGWARKEVSECLKQRN